MKSFKKYIRDTYQTPELTFDLLPGDGGNSFTRTNLYFFLAVAMRLLNLEGNFSANYTQ